MARTPDRSDPAGGPSREKSDRPESGGPEKRDRSDAGKTGSDELARILRERREQLGMSRQDLADATGIPYPTVAQIETAYRGVSPARLGLIARELGLDPKELYDVLASGGAQAVGAKASTPAAGSGRPRTGRRAEGARGAPAGATWHQNPSFAAAMPMGAPPPAPRRAPSAVLPAAAPPLTADASALSADALPDGVGSPHGAGSPPQLDDRSAQADVIEHVVDLLASLPPEQRIEALGRIQGQLLEQMVEERLAGDT